MNIQTNEKAEGARYNASRMSAENSTSTTTSLPLPLSLQKAMSGTPCAFPTSQSVSPCFPSPSSSRTPPSRIRDGRRFPSDRSHRRKPSSSATLVCFSCPVCQKQFVGDSSASGVQSNFMRHLKMVHSSASMRHHFPCPYCDASFTINGNRTRHIRTKHTEEFQLAGMAGGSSTMVEQYPSVGNASLISSWNTCFPFSSSSSLSSSCGGDDGGCASASVSARQLAHVIDCASTITELCAVLPQIKTVYRIAPTHIPRAENEEEEKTKRLDKHPVKAASIKKMAKEEPDRSLIENTEPAEVIQNGVRQEQTTKKRKEEEGNTFLLPFSSWSLQEWWERGCPPCCPTSSKRRDSTTKSGRSNNSNSDLDKVSPEDMNRTRENLQQSPIRPLACRPSKHSLALPPVSSTSSEPISAPPVPPPFSPSLLFQMYTLESPHQGDTRRTSPAETTTHSVGVPPNNCADVNNHNTNNNHHHKHSHLNLDGTGTPIPFPASLAMQAATTSAISPFSSLPPPACSPISKVYRCVPCGKLFSCASILLNHQRDRCTAAAQAAAVLRKAPNEPSSITTHSHQEGMDEMRGSDALNTISTSLSSSYSSSPFSSSEKQEETNGVDHPHRRRESHPVERKDVAKEEPRVAPACVSSLKSETVEGPYSYYDDYYQYLSRMVEKEREEKENEKKISSSGLLSSPWRCEMCQVEVSSRPRLRRHQSFYCPFRENAFFQHHSHCCSSSRKLRSSFSPPSSSFPFSSSSHKDDYYHVPHTTHLYASASGRIKEEINRRMGVIRKRLRRKQEERKEKKMGDEEGETGEEEEVAEEEVWRRCRKSVFIPRNIACPVDSCSLTFLSFHAWRQHAIAKHPSFLPA